MNIYLAAPWKHKEDAKAARQTLQLSGFTVTSRWLDFNSTPNPNREYDKPETYSTETLRLEALKDLEDIQRSEALIVLNLALSEGKATEQGIAMVLGIPIIVVGRREDCKNVFQNIPDLFTWVPTLEDAITLLQSSIVVPV